jgi:orotate phosphoribosyltransferase
MDPNDVLGMFRESGALLEGHFVLTSGLHSDRYFQCAKVLQYPRFCERLCGDITAALKGKRVDAIIAPALGGIVVGQEVGRQLGVRTMFAERKDGQMQLRRGFAVEKGEHVGVCEDVVTTGGSVGEVIGIVTRMGGLVAAAAYIVDRSGGAIRFPVVPGGIQHAVLTMEVTAYQPGSCPLCSRKIPLVKPGSRGNM